MYIYIYICIAITSISKFSRCAEELSGCAFFIQSINIYVILELERAEEYFR